MKYLLILLLPACSHFNGLQWPVDDRIEDIGFEGIGCAISKSSASMMTESLKGKTKEEADDLFRKFHEMVTQGNEAGGDPAELGKLAAFSGVSRYPVRVKCATLPWHTMLAALVANRSPVSTE